MNPRYLLMSLVCLGWLLTAGCTPPVEPAPTVTATIPAPTATPTSAATPLPTTPTPEPTASPLPSTPSLAEVLATQGAQATAYASLPTRTATPTWMPTLTFTSTSGPVWRILFQAVPCTPSINECGIDLYMEEVSRWYIIESDGSDLVALEATETFLVDLWGSPHLSPDGTHLAYLVRSKTDDELHLMLSEISSGHTSDLGVVSQQLRELKFLPEPGCLALYTAPRWDERPAVETLTVTKRCAGSTEHQILETIEFPNIRPVFNRYYLSPQGDALLIMTRNADNIPEVYIYEFGSQEPPRLVFTGTDEAGFPYGPARWLPDGQGVEFFAQLVEPDGSVKELLYASNRQATDIQVKLELNLPFSLEFGGDWSPDGRELAFFPALPKITPEVSGIYILDLETGEWWQIVSGLYSDTPGIQAWSAEIP